MDLLETQYSQYYAMAAVPPFDPKPSTSKSGGAGQQQPPPAISAYVPVFDPVLAATVPTLIASQVQQAQLATLAAIQRQQAALVSAAPALPLRPDSVASTSTTHSNSNSQQQAASTVPPTPTGQLSPAPAPTPVSGPATPGLPVVSSPAALPVSSPPVPLLPVSSPLATGPLPGGPPALMPLMYNPLMPFMPVNEDTLKDYVRKQMYLSTSLISLMTRFSMRDIFREYYFSPENLQKDFFLRRKMDPEGYLPLSLIASFHRVQALTHDIRLIIESLRDSDRVELDRDALKVTNPTLLALLLFRPFCSTPGPSSDEPKRMDPKLRGDL